MAGRTTRIYVVYAEGDDPLRERLIQQARASKLNIEFNHMPSKMPWVPTWKGTCRNRVIECNGAVVLLTKKTLQAEGVKTELGFVAEMNLPILSVYMDADRPALPHPLNHWPVMEWNGPEVARTLQKIISGTYGDAMNA